MKRTLYIAHFNHHQSLKEMILGDKPITMGVQILDIEMACLPQDFDRNLTELLLYHNLSHESLPLLKKSMTFHQHIKDAISMALTLSAYQIELDALPQTTSLDKEKYIILKEALKLIPKFIIPTGFDAIYYLETDMKHEYKHFLDEHHISPFTFETFDKKTIEIKTALNRRTEIEGAFLAEETDHTLHVFPNQESIHLYTSIYSRYKDLEIKESQVDKIINIFQNLVNYRLFGLSEDLYELIRNKMIPISNPQQEIHQDKFSHGQTPSQGLIDAVSQFNQHFTSENYSEVLFESYEYLRERNLGSITFLKKFLEKYAHQYDLNTHAFMIAHLSNLKQRPQTKGYYTFDTMPLKGAKKAIFFGLNAQNYPAIKAQTGLFDEVYRSKIQDFPSLNIRTAYTIEQKNKCFKKTEELTLSYAHSSLEGKKMEPAFLITQSQNKKHTPWPTKENQISKKEINLSPDISNQLFFKQNELYTSISKIQFYMIDPQAFFKEVGLKLRKKELSNFDMRILGTLNHAFLEDQSLNFESSLMEQHIPLTNEVLMVLRRNQDLMKRNLEIINQAKKESDAQILMNECEVKGSIEKINFKGYIDRVDQINQGVLLYDYKSSHHNLSITSLLRGENLQLLAYANLFQQQEKKPVLGAFYFNLAFSRIEDFTYQYKYSSGLQKVAETQVESLYLNNKRYNGWFFEDLALNFDTSDHYVGMSTLKSQDIKIGTIYEYEQVQKALKEVLKGIKDLIASGKLNPYELELKINIDDFEFKKGAKS